ncbi:hypothetical protein QUF58_13485 [Anaerolineales bacterium HSG24]|nr:hypothetical protein [Anaerolineales bacterium HSG24]
MRLAPLNNQVVFKKLFQDKEILCTFVKDLTGLDIDPERIETEKKFDPPIGHIDIELDIFAEDSAHRIIVEIQRIRYEDHFDRFLHYWLAAIIDLAKSHRQYELTRQVHTIVWLTRKAKDKRFQHDIVVTKLDSSISGGTLSLYPHKLYFLNPFYPNEHTPPMVTEWFRLVVESIENPDNPNIVTERDVLHKAFKLISDDGLSPSDRATMIDELEWERTLKNNRTEGIDLGQAKIIVSLHERGMTVAEIAEMTSLPIVEVERLLKLCS